MHKHQALVFEVQPEEGVKGPTSHFMGRVKRRNRVVFHSSSPIFLITQWLCYHLKGKHEDDLESGRSPVLREIGYCVYPVQNPFPGLPAGPSLVPQSWHLALNQAKGFALLSAGWTGAGMAFTPCCRHGPLSTAQHTYTALLQSAQAFFWLLESKLQLLPR